MDISTVRRDRQTWVWIHSIGLGYVIILDKVVGNSGYITILCKRWDVTTNTFHLLTDEWTMILEDIF